MHDQARVHSCGAPDAVIEFSFHGPPGAPARLAGREAIRVYSRQVMASPLVLEEYEVAELTWIPDTGSCEQKPHYLTASCPADQAACASAACEPRQ